MGPAQPISPAGNDFPPPGESVGRAQPIDPARRQPPPGGATDAEPEREPPPEPGDPERSGRRPPAGRPAASRRARAATARGAVDRVRRADFAVVLRGYDRAAVDAYVADVAQLVAELEATQLPETVVQRALDEVGDETSAILKRAHEAGEDIAARSRSQAEGRLQRAEREADLTRKEAEDQVRKLEEDIQSIWQERQRLIEDVRTLADDVLALADDAIERLPAPSDQGGIAEGSAETSAAEGPDEPVDAEARPDGGDDAREGAPGPTSTPIGLAPPPSDPSSRDDEGAADDATIEHRPEDEDTAERPPGAAGV